MPGKGRTQRQARCVGLKRGAIGEQGDQGRIEAAGTLIGLQSRCQRPVEVREGQTVADRGPARHSHNLTVAGAPVVNVVYRAAISARGVIDEARTAGRSR